MYAAYQLHDRLRTVKIVGLYLVQRPRLTGDWRPRAESNGVFLI